MYSALTFSTSFTKQRIESYNALWGDAIHNKLMNLLISLAHAVVVPPLVLGVGARLTTQLDGLHTPDWITLIRPN